MSLFCLPLQVELGFHSPALLLALVLPSLSPPEEVAERSQPLTGSSGLPATHSHVSSGAPEAGEHSFGRQEPVVPKKVIESEWRSSSPAGEKGSWEYLVCRRQVKG